MSSGIRQSTALAFMRESPHDIRPDLLLYVAEQDDERFPRLFLYGCAYLTAWISRNQQSAPEDAIQLAVNDALMLMRTRKTPYTLKERSKEIRVRLRTFRALRAKATEMFERRYREAVERYKRAKRGNDLHPEICSFVRRREKRAPQPSRPERDHGFDQCA